MEIDVKYRPGQKVWAVHKYPAGAKVLEEEVYQTNIIITESQGVKVSYYLKGGFKNAFMATEVFTTEEAALAVKNEWCDRPDVKERAEKLYKHTL